MPAQILGAPHVLRLRVRQRKDAAAALGIAALGPEDLARAALEAADVVAPSIDDALDLLLHPRRLVATLRR